MEDELFKVLLVEDNLGDFKWIDRMLKEANTIQVDLVHLETLKDALKRLDKENFDIILLDLGLPDSQGLDTFFGVYAVAQNVPIVVLTGLVDEEAGIIAVKGGAQDYLIKGLDSNLLVRALRYAIERQRAEKELRKSEEKYRNIFENIIDVYFELDMNENILEISPSIEFISNYKRNDLIGKSLNNLCLYPEQQNALIKDILERGEIRDYNIQLKDNNGSNLHCSIIAKLMIDKNEIPIKIIGSMRDITERNQAEQALALAEIQVERWITKLKEANQLKSEFFNFVFHDLSTPITLLKGYTKLLLDSTLGEINEKQEKVLKTIFQNIEQLDRLRIDTLNISKIDIGQIILEKLNASINELIEISVSSFKGLLDEKKQEIIIKIEKKLSANCDPDKILQVIENYLSNAIKYTPKGGKIEITTKEEKDAIHVCVKDNGRGIKKDEIKNIFNYSPGEKAKGVTGLGLAVTKAIIEAHEGKVWCESEIGKGSAFHFMIPKL